MFRLNRLFQNKKMKRVMIGFVVIFCIAFIFFLLRGPYLSNSIKKLIQPAIEKAIGEKVIIDKAVINLFPFYLQTKGFKIFDKEGNRILWVKKMRAYIDLLGLFSKEIRIRRLTVREPELTTDKEMLEKIINSVKRHTKRDDGKGFGVTLKSTKITNGKFTITGIENQTTVSGSGLYVRMFVKNTTDIELSINDGTLKRADLLELNAGLSGKVKISDRKIKILKAKVYSSKSVLETAGEMQLSPKGVVEQGILSGRANILVETIAKTFGLKEENEGELSFSGSVDLVSTDSSEIPKFNLNLKTKGWFYLQALMELLKVKENITGRISFNGEIHGIYPDVVGRGVVKLKDAVLDTLPLADVNGRIIYENKKFSLKNFVAHTYGGELKGNAFLFIPGGDYLVDASGSGVNSIEFFRFIKWEPPFPEGKINGSFRLNKLQGRKIELIAEANYLNTSKDEGQFLNERLMKIKANINMREGILTFNDAVLSTHISELFLDGNIDLAGERLDLNLLMKSKDASDLISPYFTGLKAPVRFKGRAVGPLSEPEISGRVIADSGTINGVPFTEVQGDLTYSPKFLSVKLLKIKQGDSSYEVSGSIAFRKAEWLFSFDAPYYRGNAVIKNGDAKSLITAIYKEIPIKGYVSGKISFEGDVREFKGNGDITLENGVVFNQPVDRAIIKAVLSPENISFPLVEIHRNKSRLKANGSVYFDERFNVLISSDSVSSKDLAIFNKYPIEINFSADVKGSGTFRKPDVKFSLKILESYFRGVLIGKGDIKGELHDKKLSARGNFLEGIITAETVIFFSETLPWVLNVEFKNGRYDFLLAGLLKDIPKDLSSCSLKGDVKLSGKRNKFSMNSKFSFMSFSLYGYNFKNKGDIVLEFTEDIFNIKSFSISGNAGDITATGSAKIGQNYNLSINGKIDLTPLKGLTKTINSLKGQSDFAIEITGNWKSPELKGEINISDSTVMVAGVPYKIGPLNGSIFFDKDRIVFDYFNADFAGGRVIASGIGHLKGLSLNRLYISSEVKGIKLKHIEGVDVVSDGSFFLETSPQRQSLTGYMSIKKARYKKRVEWKSWLLPLKEVKETIVKQPSFLGKTMLNVHVTGQDNIFIDNNIARTPVKIDLNIQGTLAQYWFIGRIEAKGGTIFFRNNEFEIIEGSVDFVETNRIVPVFHIRAETFTSGYRIRLDLDGPVDRFALSLFSDPPLSDTDILTLLTVGHISKESKGFESGVGAGEATAFLTGRLQDVIEERLRYITGFERFEVNPQTTTTGAVSPRVTVGKRLLGEKLFVTYSTSIGTTEEHIIKLQYNLSKNFSIVGLRDEVGSVGADIKFRFEFK